MPTGDNIAAAIAISGASGNTIYGNFTNAGAGVESGEPGHHKYNPSPVIPLTNSQVGPWNTIWFVWTCPTSGNYYFSTRNSSPTNAWLTNFPSTCNAFELLSGTVAANNLLRETPLMDQSVGDANGTDLGASVAFAATAGTTYYIQVDSRTSGVTGNVALFWGPYTALTLGGCASGALNFDSSAQCVGAVRITDLTTNGFYSFGSIPAAPGNYVVVLNYGTAIQALNGSSNPCAAVVDGNAAGFTIWADLPDNAGSGPVSQPAYGAGAVVCDPDTFNFSVAAMAVPACAPGSPGAAGVYWSMPLGPGSGSQFGPGYSSYDPNTSYNVGDWEGPGGGSINIVCATACPAHGPYGNGCTQNGGIYWNCLGTYNPPASLCAQTIVPHHAVTSPIGIGLIGSSSATNGPQNPTYQLIYYPITIGLLTNEQGWNELINQSWYGGSPTSWKAKFNISNHSSQDWDETTVTLLTGGGISSPSAPQVIDIAPSTYSSPSSSTNEFTFTADQTAGLMTATLQISRNGIVVGNLVYPLYPILTATLATNTQEENCTGPSGGPVIGNSWKNTFTFTLLWPPSSTGGDATGFAGFTENTIAACGDGSGPGTCQLSPTATVVSGPSLMTYEVEEGPYAAICTAVSSISAPQCSGLASGTMDVWLQAGSTPQAAELQLTFYFQTGPSTIFTLSTITFNLTVNAA